MRDAGLKLIGGCTNGVASEYKGILGCFELKKFCSKVANFLNFFAYPESQIFWKMTHFFVERYRPEICRWLHKWCCERMLRRFRSFQARKFFWKLAIYWLFLHIRGHRFLEKWLTFFERDMGLNFIGDSTNSVSNKCKGILGCFQRKKNFLKIGNFLTFFAYPESQIPWKMIDLFFSQKKTNKSLLYFIFTQVKWQDNNKIQCILLNFWASFTTITFLANYLICILFKLNVWL